MSAAISIRINNKDRKRSYKPQFEIITDEDQNIVLNIANLNPNYQSYEIKKVFNETSASDLPYEKQLTVLNGGLNVLKIEFKKVNRVAQSDNLITIKYFSIICVEYAESVSIPIDEERNIINGIKGIVFK